MGVRRIVIHGVDIEDKPGSLQKFLAQSSLSGVDFLYFVMFSCGHNRGRVYVSAKDPKCFETFAKEADIDVTAACGFLIDGDDKVGAAAEALKDLAENDIDEVAGYAMVCDGRYQMLIVVDDASAKRAARVLNA
jgi:hypothetical protein